MDKRLSMQWESYVDSIDSASVIAFSILNLKVRSSLRGLDSFIPS